MMNFLTVTWDVDPVMIKLGGFEVMWYGLCWMLAILGGALFFINAGKREGLSPKLADNIFWWGTLATIIGARLGHCFFYEPAYYFSHPLELLDIRGGGMASHGAAVGLLLGLWGFSRRNKLPYIWSLDRIMVPVAIGGAIVRIGNLINSEIYGHATDLPWGFIFVNRGETVAMHPTQIYEALCYLVTFAVLAFLYYKRDAGRRRPGVMFGVGLIGVFLTRFVIEFVKNPQIAAEQTMTINIGQILSIPFVLAGVLMIVWPYTGRALKLDPMRWAGLKPYKEPKKK
ncbi:MAG: prolipoprotein diacylglyceryl transferase [Alistipes sp.]|jgi:prolipoprotein diacylglyceryl transferase|nr:prolipoprotein diacylglyceryl transferase [Alistipes sp.]